MAEYAGSSRPVFVPKMQEQSVVLIIIPRPGEATVSSDFPHYPSQRYPSKQTMRKTRSVESNLWHIHQSRQFCHSFQVFCSSATSSCPSPTSSHILLTPSTASTPLLSIPSSVNTPLLSLPSSPALERGVCCSTPSRF